MTFIITNTGGGILNWAITTNQNWLTCDPVSGLTTTERDTIAVKVARVGLADGINTGTITVTPDVGSARTISVTLNIPAPERLWSFSVNSASTDSDLDAKWVCDDLNDDIISGKDYWGVATYGGNPVIWCAGRGDHSQGVYANNMDAVMRLKSDQAIDIREYSDVEIKFSMRFEIESGYDYMYLMVLGTDQVWYFAGNASRWTGDNLVTLDYSVSLEEWGNVAPSNYLRLGFEFTSDGTNAYMGALINDIEVWGRPK